MKQHGKNLKEYVASTEKGLPSKMDPTETGDRSVVKSYSRIRTLRIAWIFKLEAYSTG